MKKVRVDIVLDVVSLKAVVDSSATSEYQLRWKCGPRREGRTKWRSPSETGVVDWKESFKMEMCSVLDASSGVKAPSQQRKLLAMNLVRRDQQDTVSPDEIILVPIKFELCYETSTQLRTTLPLEMKASPNRPASLLNTTVMHLCFFLRMTKSTPEAPREADVHMASSSLDSESNLVQPSFFKSSETTSSDDEPTQPTAKRLAVAKTATNSGDGGEMIDWPEEEPGVISTKRIDSFTSSEAMQAAGPPSFMGGQGNAHMRQVGEAADEHSISSMSSQNGILHINNQSQDFALGGSRIVQNKYSWLCDSVNELWRHTEMWNQVQTQQQQIAQACRELQALTTALQSDIETTRADYWRTAHQARSNFATVVNALQSCRGIESDAMERIHQLALDLNTDPRILAGDIQQASTTPGPSTEASNHQVPRGSTDSRAAPFCSDPSCVVQ